MLDKNINYIVKVLEYYKAGTVTKEEAIQAIQNIIGEEVLRVDIPVDKFEVEEGQDG
jgi:hypothetical protein